MANTVQLSYSGAEINRRLAQVMKNVSDLSENFEKDREFRENFANSSYVTSSVLSNYALKSELPDVSNFATKEELVKLFDNTDTAEIDSLIEVINILNEKYDAGQISYLLNDYLTEAEAAAQYQPKGNYQAAGEYVKPNDLNDYATISYVDAKISGLLNGVDTEHDTLKEIVDLLNEKQDAAAFISALASKADKSDLDDYALKSELPEVPSIDSLISEEDADAKYQPKGDYLTEHQSLADYALKSELPEVPSIDDLISEEDADAKYQPKGNYLTEHQSLADYALKSELPEVPSIDGLITETAADNKYQPKGYYLTEHAGDERYILQGEGVTIDELTYFSLSVAEKYQPKGNYLTEHQSLADYALKSELPVVPSIVGLATEQYVDGKISDLVANAPAALDTLNEIAEKLSMDDDLFTAMDTMLTKKANSKDVYTKAEIDAAGYLTNHQDLSDYALKSELPSVDGLISEEDADAKYQPKGEYLVESDLEGYAKTEDLPEVPSIDGLISEEDADAKYQPKGEYLVESDLEGYAKTEDLPEVPSIDGLISEEDADAKYQPKGEYLVESDLDNYALKSELPTVPTKVSAFENDAEYLTEHQSLVGYATEQYVDDKISYLLDGVDDNFDTLKELADALTDEDTGLGKVNDALNDKANVVDVYDKTTADGKFVDKAKYDELNDKYTTLFNVVYQNATGETATALNADYVANNLSNNNTSVEITEGELGDVTIPETTKTMSVTAPMQDGATVTLSSPKAFNLINTSDEPVDVTIDAPAGTSIPTMSLSGDFENLTVNNGTISAKSGADPLTATNVTVDNEIGKNVSISGIVFNDNATITTSSVPSLGVANNNTDQNAPNATINAENSTVTMNKGEWNELTSNVGADTLIVTQNAHINQLNVVKGNVIVNDREISNRIGAVVNETEYTVSLNEHTATTGNELNSYLTGNPGIVNIGEDITRGRITWGIFGSGNYLLDLKGHTVTLSDANFGLKTRNTVNIKIVDTVGGGKLINDKSYGPWADEDGVITLDIPETTEIIGETHTLYAYGSRKPHINVIGGTYKMTIGDDETDIYDANGNYKFLLNHYDATYTREGNCFTITGGTFYGFDPSRMNGDPGAEYSMIDLNNYEVQVVGTFVDSKEHTMNVYKVVKK